MSNPLIEAARELRDQVDQLTFAPPVACVYNPLDYAWDAHRQYLDRYGHSPKRVVFLGMNPGPWGMAQTGVPFGEIDAVRDWLGIRDGVIAPATEHPRRPVSGFDCPRSEVSGRRLWGLFQERFGPADAFFRDHFVANYCPLVFMEESGRNRTPDKLPTAEQAALFAACDRHLVALADILHPEWFVGVGKFAEDCLRRALARRSGRIARILHPSPASPAANRDWAGTATRQLRDAAIWTD